MQRAATNMIANLKGLPHEGLIRINFLPMLEPRRKRERERIQKSLEVLDIIYQYGMIKDESLIMQQGK